MILQLPLSTLFPDGAIMHPPPGKSHALEPLESTFDGATCFVYFRIARLKDRDVELTAWYKQATGGDLERVVPIFDGSEWHADMNS